MTELVTSEEGDFGFEFDANDLNRLICHSVLLPFLIALCGSAPESMDPAMTSFRKKAA